MTLNLHIDRMIIEGLTLPHSQRSKFQASVEAELSRLFSVHGVPLTVQKGDRIPHILADLPITNQPNPVQLGQQLAQSIYTHLQNDRTKSINP
ncbi:MAG: hypothetical protein WBA76_13235 [Phormidesmis sp.]